jgi:two-component system, NtrC family, response regulator AtoC
MEPIRLIVVSREPSLLRMLHAIGVCNGWQVEMAGSAWDAMEWLQGGMPPHLLAVDFAHGDDEGAHLLRWVGRLQHDLPLLVVCDREDAQKAKETGSLGAGIGRGYEILIRPFDRAQLEEGIRLALGKRESKYDHDAEAASDHVEALGEDAFFVSASLAMQKLRAQAAVLAQTDVPVLIVGEPGAGKYTVASLIHQLSVRSGFKLLRLDCAQMPEAILEAELFGNDPARRTEAGRSVSGTIYLDEITALPARLQMRLLQVLENQRLQSGDFRRAGSATTSDARILASSTANLEKAVAEKRLREDLYCRLSAFTVLVPPLRQRKDEIVTLLHYLMHKVAKRYNLPPREFSPATLDACRRYSWPGNLKELDGFIKRFLVAGEQELPAAESGLDHRTNGDAGMVSESSQIFTPLADIVGAEAPAKPESLKSMIQGIKSEVEQSAIAAALKRTGWNRKAASRLLRVSYRTLLYKIEQYNMRAPEPYLSPISAAEFALCMTENKRRGKAS